jgi:hypothetical protein
LLRICSAAQPTFRGQRCLQTRHSSRLSSDKLPNTQVKPFEESFFTIKVKPFEESFFTIEVKPFEESLQDKI